MYPFKGTGKPSKLFEMILRGPSTGSYPSKQISAGYHTPRNKFLRGIMPLGTNFCGVLYPCTQIFAGYHAPQNKFAWSIRSDPSAQIYTGSMSCPCLCLCPCSPHCSRPCPCPCPCPRSCPCPRPRTCPRPRPRTCPHPPVPVTVAVLVPVPVSVPSLFLSIYMSMLTNLLGKMLYSMLDCLNIDIGQDLKVNIMYINRSWKKRFSVKQNLLRYEIKTPEFRCRILPTLFSKLVPPMTIDMYSTYSKSVSPLGI
jgi:hypothetical protein